MLQRDAPGPDLPAPTQAAALTERALAGDDAAAADLIRRLCAGDGRLARSLARENADAGRARAAVLRYLATGTWADRAPPLPPGFHAGREARHLHDLIMHAACDGPPESWLATLLDGLRDRHPSVRRTAASLLAECRRPAVLHALAARLSDADERVRWAAALALGTTSGAAVPYVLRRLAGRDLSPEMRHVAAYVLRAVPDDVLRRELAPVVQALDASDYRLAAPLAAGAALQRRDGPPPG